MTIRRSDYDVSNTVNTTSPTAVNEATTAIFHDLYPRASYQLVDRVFHDIERLFKGEYSDFFSCETSYHNLQHTLEVALATARLISGHEQSCAKENRLGPEKARLGIIVALFHDAGYIRHTSDTDVDHGAQLTPIHVERGASFIRDYFPLIGLNRFIHTARRLVHYTGYEVALKTLRFRSSKLQTLGHIIGSADLIAQMSDRQYLEKCRDFLYPEFVAGGLDQCTMKDGNTLILYGSAEDLLRKTPDFYQQVILKRLQVYFQSVYQYAAIYFGGDNLYMTHINKNIDFLVQLIQADDLSQLKRTPTR
jgi:hypothetical protein